MSASDSCNAIPASVWFTVLLGSWRGQLAMKQLFAMTHKQWLDRKYRRMRRRIARIDVRKVALARRREIYVKPLFSGESVYGTKSAWFSRRS